MFKWIHNQNKAYWKEVKENFIPALIISIIVAIVSATTGIEYMTVTIWFAFACCGLALVTLVYISTLTLYRHIVKKQNKSSGGKYDKGSL